MKIICGLVLFLMVISVAVVSGEGVGAARVDPVYLTITHAEGGGGLTAKTTTLSKTVTGDTIEDVQLESKTISDIDGAHSFGMVVGVSKTIYGPDIIRGNKISVGSSIMLPFQQDALQTINCQLSPDGGMGSIENLLGPENGGRKFVATGKFPNNRAFSSPEISLGQCDSLFSSSTVDFMFRESNFVIKDDLTYEGALEFKKVLEF